jgi:DNA-binding ferritin-like protein
MTKSLSESAAEILKASLASAGKEPAAKLPSAEEDLGGETNEVPDGGDVGKKAAASVKQAAKPGQSGAPSEPIKKMSTEEVEQVDEGASHLLYTGEVNGKDYEYAVPSHHDLSDDDVVHKALKRGDNDHLEPHEIQAIVDSGGEEESHVDVTHNGKKYTHHVINHQEPQRLYGEEVEQEISEAELAEAKKKMRMDMVAKHKGSMAEDVNALFNGESLSEEFRVKATTIFEAAVQSRVEKIVEDVIADNESILEEAVEGIKAELGTQVDEYLNYVVERWMEDNAVAIESGLRSELTEDFINGLKNLFAEHYIDLPDEKLEVAESLAERVVELEEASAARDEQFVALSKELNEAKKNEAIRKICEGLTEVQVGKMKSLAEGVEFTTEGEFNNKLAVIRENYFPTKKIVSEVKVSEETSTEQPEVVANGIMSHYVKAISKSLPK